MVDVGRLGGVSGVSHSVQPTTEPTKGMPTYEKAFPPVQDMQASYKAFMQETEKENPLEKRIIVPFKRGQQPYGGKEVSGPATNVPSSRG